MDTKNRAIIFMSAILLLLKGFCVSMFPIRKRTEEIRGIISDLQELKSNGQFVTAIDMNIDFFRFANNLFRFIPWFIFYIPKIRIDLYNLLELGDLPIVEWQPKGYIGLAKIEDNRFARIMVTDFINELCRLVLKVNRLKPRSESVVIFDLGCGGGCLCSEVLCRNKRIPIVCIGIDNMPANIELAKARFTPIHDRGEVIFKSISKICDNTIDNLSLEAKRTGRNVFAIYRGDFFKLDKLISSSKIDMIFHSRVIHHLGLEDRYLLERMCQRLSFITVELEDIYSRVMPLLAAIVTWGIDHCNPALMNGGVLSCIRDPGKEDLHGYIKRVLPNSYVRLILGEKGFHRDGYSADTKAELTDSFIWYG
jgi:SAM-dependent methyltransferase